MYNWTNDAPYDTKKYFLEAIEYFNKNNQKVLSGQTVKVLEIGTYTGTSLINIIKLIPNSIGYGLDKWSNYIEYNTNNRVELLNSINELEIEASFYKNIQVGGLEGRIKGIKGDSYEKLFQMIKEEQQFDFIYVDGSHLLLDCYTDIILSWKILAKGGLLAIDDYLYVSTENMYQSPLAGVNHFLLKHREEIKILHKGYRVFLIKL
jgi:predicted O-methyltransferase YrrM